MDIRLIVLLVGSPCLLILILVCVCIVRAERARELGVLRRKSYKFFKSGKILSPPIALGPIMSRPTGSQSMLIINENPQICVTEPAADDTTTDSAVEASNHQLCTVGKP